MTFIDSFDHDTTEPKGLRGENLDKYILSTAKEVSIFWITETMARATRCEKWQQEGKIDLCNKSLGFPWLKIRKCVL